MPMNNPTDLAKHVTSYGNLKSTFEDFAGNICELVGEYRGKNLIHTTEHRAK
jgi:hypothetical protein